MASGHPSSGQHGTTSLVAELNGQKDFFTHYTSSIRRWIRIIDRRKRQFLQEVLATTPLTGRRVLDAGCGTGQITAPLRASGFVVHGLDANGSLLQVAARAGLRCVQGDLRWSLPFRCAVFDAVVITDVLEHVLDPGAVIREAFRVLAPEGRVIVFTPPYDSVTWVGSEWVYRRIFRERWLGHVCPWTRESMERFCERLNMRCRIRYLNLGLTLAVEMRRRGAGPSPALHTEALTR